MQVVSKSNTNIQYPIHISPALNATETENAASSFVPSTTYATLNLAGYSSVMLWKHRLVENTFSLLV
jgi:hypothetical protein